MNHQKDTDTKLFVKRLMYFQFGLYVSLSLITIAVMSVIVSGDSVKQRQQQREAVRTLTMPPSTQIK
jgi:hypothetical protein